MRTGIYRENSVSACLFFFPQSVNDIWMPPILQVIKEEGVRVVVYTGYGESAIIPVLFRELKEADIMLEGNTDEGYIWLGTGIGNIRRVKRVVEVLNDLSIQ